jgi:hypothetical protein
MIISGAEVQWKDLEGEGWVMVPSQSRNQPSSLVASRHGTNRRKRNHALLSTTLLHFAPARFPVPLCYHPKVEIFVYPCLVELPGSWNWMKRWDLNVTKPHAQAEGHATPFSLAQVFWSRGKADPKAFVSCRCLDHRSHRSRIVYLRRRRCHLRSFGCGPSKSMAFAG